jgi:hypothetical protein
MCFHCDVAVCIYLCIVMVHCIMRCGWHVESEKLRTNVGIFKINESMPFFGACKN